MEYEVLVVYTLTALVSVEAGSEEEAIKKAKELVPGHDDDLDEIGEAGAALLGSIADKDACVEIASKSRFLYELARRGGGTDPLAEMADDLPEIVVLKRALKARQQELDANKPATGTPPAGAQNKGEVDRG